ncbi:MAG TPA: hypothetical protein GXZ35_03150 [Acholeplasmataceae bacterium]|nr:hypothetical protein [Acholeplasmataceae bacterium]
MNSYERKNIKLLNLVDQGFSGRTISKVIDNCMDHYITEEDLIRVLGNTLTSNQIINAFKDLDTSAYSIHCLSRFDINMFVIDKLSLEYKTLEELSKNLKTLSKMHLQVKTENKIIEALKLLKLNYFVDLDEDLFQEIKNNEPYPNNKLKEKFLNQYPSLKVDEFDSHIDKLIKLNRVFQSIDGLKVKKNTIIDYLSKSKDDRDLMLFQRLKGHTLQQIAEDKNVTRERVRQIINKRISKYPIFYNEEKYYRILNFYDLSDSELELIGLEDKYLSEYVKIKYKLNPLKSSLDYIVDFNMSGTDLAQKILKNNNLVLIGGDLIQEDFIQIFKKYINTKSIRSFSLVEIKEEFNMFLKSIKVNSDDIFIKTNEDIIIKNRKLENSGFFLSFGNQRFIVYKPDTLGSDFTEALDNFLSEFYGYGSISLFYECNVELCKKNYVKDEKELYAITKALFGNKYIDRIDFVRNPVILSKGLNKEAYIENMILDMDLPCDVDKYLDHVNKVTGLKKESIYGQFSKMINKYKNSQGLITLDNEVTNEQYDFVKNIIGNNECIGYTYLFERIERKYGFDAQIILNDYNLRKIGFTKTNTSIYSIRFLNRLDAVIDAIDKLDQYIILENELRKITNIEYLYYRVYDFIDTNVLVKISKNSYLNLKKRNQCALISKFKNDFLSIINSNEVYVLKNFIYSSTFNALIEMNNEYKELLFSFDTVEIIRSIVLSLREINYIETNDTFIFSKKELSISKLIDDTLNEYGSLSLYELQEALFDKYRIQKIFSNGELSDMGYYCPKSSEKVYLNKEYYEKELEEYLNGNT